MSPDRPKPSLQSGHQPSAAHAEHDAAVKLHFLASLNHEIRTPLSGILGMAELLLETRLDAEQGDYVQAVRSCASTLYELLNDTLEYTAIASDSITLDIAEFDVHENLSAAYDEFAARLVNPAESIEFYASPQLPRTAIGDVYRIRQLLTLLLQYARRQETTTTGGTPVRITVEDATSTSRQPSPGMLLRMTLSHPACHPQGLGVEEQLRNFDLLEQGFHRRFDSLGLGLALARRIARLLGGEFTVRSLTGGDTLIRAEIPLQPAARTTVTAHSNTSVDALAVSQRVLVVEDNRIAMQVLTALLAKGMLEFDTAADGPSAIAASAARRYDLILMDVQMPGMDGIEATRHIRELSGYSHVPILALTADTNDDVRAACRQAGMDAFLNKPIHAAELLSTVRRYLAG